MRLLGWRLLPGSTSRHGFHKSTLRSSPAVKQYVPSELNAAAFTVPWCAESVAASVSDDDENADEDGIDTRADRTRGLRSASHSSVSKPQPRTLQARSTPASDTLFTPKMMISTTTSIRQIRFFGP